MIKELIGEDDLYLREIPEEYDFGKSLEYEPEELKAQKRIDKVILLDQFESGPVTGHWKG